MLLDFPPEMRLPSKGSRRDPAYSLVGDTDLSDSSTAQDRPTTSLSLAYARLTFRRRTRTRRLVFVVIATTVTVLLSFLIWSLLLAVLFPVYNVEPPSHAALRRRISSTDLPGRGNPSSEKIFISANIINADLVSGAWGQAIQELVHILGPDNVFVSVYENDAGSDVEDALRRLDDKLSCNTSIVTGAHIDLSSLPHTPVSSTTSAVKRITYLAEVRNRALSPLDPSHTTQIDHGFASTTTSFDKILFLNDVYFDPTSAANLLFSTHVDTSGTARYEAACAADFVSGINFYDSYATHDHVGRGLGYGPGFRIFPWFAPGKARQAVLAGDDAIAVRACWGGMVAFKASYFQSQGVTDTDAHPVESTWTGGSSASEISDTIVRFRAEPEAMWDASECCLVHADITSLYNAAQPPGAAAGDTGIYLNPYVRTAYTYRTFTWLPTLRRFEHFFSALQWLLTWATRSPYINERIGEIGKEGALVERVEWVWDTLTEGEAVQVGEAVNAKSGHYERVKRIARPGGFCGFRAMGWMKEDYVEANSRGRKSFVHIEAPVLEPAN